MDAEPGACLSKVSCVLLLGCVLTKEGRKVFALISLGHDCIIARENIFTGTLQIAKNRCIIHVKNRDRG